MAMTIKNERVNRKVRQLAETLATDQVTAVERAVDRMLQESRTRGSAAEARLSEVLELVRELRDTLPEGLTSGNATDGLYDADGLPS